MTSRTDASRSIEQRRVLVNGAVAEKASRLVSPGDALTITGEPERFVGRGGRKLDAALDSFGLEIGGLDVLDAGASTGGFTDCLLQRGARAVVAIDVGHGQLHPKIRDDPRVVVIERCNIRDVTLDRLPFRPAAAVADLSFISLTKVIGVLADLVVPGGSLVLLVKPQFEAGRQEVSRGQGIITDPAIHARVRGEIEISLAAHGCTPVAWVDSPITGADGNREFLVHSLTGVHR